MINVIIGDSLEVLKQFPDHHFSATCFSPPYSVGGYFDTRTDFTSGGRFIPFMKEIARVSKVWAINLAQLTDNKEMGIFIEQLIVSAWNHDSALYDRWVVRKPVPKPRRGSRPLADFEFVLVFLGIGVKAAAVESLDTEFKYRTTINVKTHPPRIVDDVTSTPYFPEIPQQVYSMYGTPGSTVLDPFCGSGTSLREAAKLGLNAVGVELNRDAVKLDPDWIV